MNNFENLQPLGHDGNHELEPAIRGALEKKPSIETILNKINRSNFESLEPDMQKAFTEYSAYHENLKDLHIEMGMLKDLPISPEEKKIEMEKLEDLQKDYGRAIADLSSQLLNGSEESHEFMKNHRKIHKIIDEMYTMTADQVSMN